MNQTSIPTIAKVSRARGRAAGLESGEMMSFSLLRESQEIPLVVRPRVKGVNLVDWMRGNRALLEQKLLAHGALLFRGFDLNGIEDFNACVDAFSGGALEYLFRASPRTQISKNFKVYSSTDYPATERIFPHNEHSYSPKFPEHLYFYADHPSPDGGETPLGSTREVMKRIDRAVRDEFVAKKVMYVRNYGDGMGLPWQTRVNSSLVDGVDRDARLTAWRIGTALRARSVRLHANGAGRIR